VELLPGLERIAGVLDLPGDSVDQAARFERLAQSLTVIGRVGEKAPSSPWISAAQTGIALARETSLGVARIDAAALIRTPRRTGDDGRVDQSAALDDEAARVELLVDLSQERNRKTELVDCPAKRPDRGVVGRLHLQRQAAKAAKRQPVGYRLPGGGNRPTFPYPLTIASTNEG
jgi:hypothetical protein